MFTLPCPHTRLMIFICHVLRPTKQTNTSPAAGPPTTEPLPRVRHEEDYVTIRNNNKYRNRDVMIISSAPKFYQAHHAHSPASSTPSLSNPTETETLPYTHTHTHSMLAPLQHQLAPPHASIFVTHDQI